MTLTNCATNPIRKKIPTCVIDADAGMGLCKRYDGKTSELENIPLELMDKNICFSPESFLMLQDYIDTLEANQR
jgi:hypothetical protein